MLYIYIYIYIYMAYNLHLKHLWRKIWEYAHEILMLICGE